MAYKQAAERMDRFLDLKIEATSSRNQYRNNDINVSCAANYLLKSVEATTLKIDLIKRLANEESGSKTALELAKAIKTMDRVAALYNQAAELYAQGKQNQYSQGGDVVSRTAEILLISFETRTRNIAWIKELDQERKKAPGSAMASELQSIIDDTSRAVDLYKQAANTCREKTEEQFNRYKKDKENAKALAAGLSNQHDPSADLLEDVADELLKSVEARIVSKKAASASKALR